ncbi:ABC-2 transporter permease [uncultured Tyzzerella sp.]|uniref:ABC-2 transporter permease n=1 Tax=uncultured Tyzzerella sp. TaxID=2321398 RepID=UPI002942537B|nr:ABC-2 transporter permease [uncultured Tyzzerella sp.]
MKGIVLKEFYQMKDDIPSFIISTIFFMILYKFLKVPFFEFSTSIVIFIIIVNTFLKQELLNNENNFNMYLNTLPININKIIMAKYLFMLSITTILLFICIVGSIFIKWEVDLLSQIKYYSLYIFVFNFYYVYFPIAYLIFISLKNNLASIIVSNLIGMVISLLLNFLLIFLMLILFKNILEIDFSSDILSEDMFLICGLICTFISAIIVCKVYKITCLKYKKNLC